MSPHEHQLRLLITRESELRLELAEVVGKRAMLESLMPELTGEKKRKAGGVRSGGNSAKIVAYVGAHPGITRAELLASIAATDIDKRRTANLLGNLIRRGDIIKSGEALSLPSSAPRIVVEKQAM